MKLTAHNAKTSCYVNKREEKEEDDMNGKLFIGSILAGVFALAHTSFSAEWKPVAGTMMTESGENISPDNAANLPKVSEEGIPKNQPNFVVILTDDQGWGTTSITVDPAVPESKSDFFKTPNLEKLASQGLRFTQAYSGHPNCSPSRAALLTGRSPAALHFTDICGRNAGGLYVGNKIIPPQHINALPERELTLPEIIKQHLPAYKAAHFGKWHLGKVGPEGHGFDAGDGPTGNREGSRKDNLPDDPKRIFSITKRANDWMAEQAKAKQPFYLQVSHYATHLGLQSRTETKQRVDKRPSGTRHQNTEFGAMIEDMDDGIGQLLAKVEELGIGDNTYIFYTADNGTFPLEEPGNINGPLRGNKATVWEAGVRVPFIIAGPGIESGTVSHAPAIGYDIYPTICDILGIADLPEQVEGGSLQPVWAAKAASVKRSRPQLVFHWPHYQHQKKSIPDSTVLLDGYKLHYFWETGKAELYNLKTDLAETKDLSRSMPEKAKELEALLHAHLKEINAQIPELNKDYDPATDPALVKVKKPKDDPGYANPGPDEVQQIAKFYFAAVARESPETEPDSTVSEKQPISPETEMAIMRVMNLENRIQTLQTVPAKMTDNELAGQFSGTWICFTTMRLNGQLGRGIMEIRLEQDGDKLVGEGGQLKHPFDPPATIRPIGTRSAAVSDFIGQFKKASKGRHNMVVIERQRVDGPTWATFTAVMAGDGRTARGTLVNAGGNYGLMFMVRREFLADFKHLLTEEGRRAESQRRWIGIENLEVALDTASMDTARIEWWKTDKNKDGKLQYLEFPHPEWKRANRNNDDVVDWAEEVSDRVLKKLAEEGDFLAKHGNDSQKQWPSIYAWGVAHPGFEQIFHFVDWDRDEKITSAEYTAFDDQLDAYNDPSFPTTNQKGQTREDLRSKNRSRKKSKGVTKTKPNADPHIVQMEAAFSEKKLAKSQEMWAALDKNHDKLWQYREFPHPDWKRANRDGDGSLSWKEELADQMFRSQSRTYPKAHGSASQKEWSSRQAWEKDRPDFTVLFPFIDWDHDGKISAAEYEVFDVQIKSYTDGSYPKTNERGESGMEVFKRLAAEAPKKPVPKTAPSRKTSWDSREEWNRDKPTMTWIFPFIDKNSDGKIDTDEYQAIQEYKKEHRDWQNQARKELGLTGPKDQ